MQGLSGSTWTDIDPSNYTVAYNYPGPAILFEVDPFTEDMAVPYPYGYPDQIRVTSQLFVMGESDSLIMGGDTTHGAIDRFLQCSVATGGPGLSTDQLDIVLDRVPIPRVYLTAITTIKSMITTLLRDAGAMLIGTIGSTTTLQFGVWWNYASGKLTIRQLPLSSDAVVYTNCQAVYENVDIRDCYSMVYSTADGWGARITDTYDPDADSGGMYYPDAYAKLIDQSLGCYKIGFVNTTGMQAVRSELQRSLRGTRHRVYVIAGDDALPPSVGINVSMPDGYTGTVTEWSFNSNAGRRTLTLTVCNLTETLE